MLELFARNSDAWIWYEAKQHSFRSELALYKADWQMNHMGRINMKRPYRRLKMDVEDIRLR